MEAFFSGLNFAKNRILLIAPPPMERGEWVPHQSLIDASLRLAQSYQALSKRLGIRFADAGGWNISLAFDGVHFTEEGHKAFAEELYQSLNKGESFMLEVGIKAPDFTLSDQDGKQVSLSDFLGRKIVLYFYPKDKPDTNAAEILSYLAGEQ